MTKFFNYYHENKKLILRFPDRVSGIYTIAVRVAYSPVVARLRGPTAGRKGWAKIAVDNFGRNVFGQKTDYC